MTTLIESLKRLYKVGRLTEAQIARLVEKGTITPADYTYITGKSYDIEDKEEA